MFKNLFKKKIKIGSLVIDSDNKIWIVNGINKDSDSAIVDTFIWYSKRSKCDYCHFRKLSDLKLVE